VAIVLAPWIVPFDAENFFDYDALNSGPSATHWFGVDPLGRDIFSRILMGTRISLAAGFLLGGWWAASSAPRSACWRATTKAGGTAS
jgi:ABC-type dipeptide/oligopeptide/nickel transport system permease subunit